ncbi:MAG: hypothetical protein VX733_14115 [Candidatus Latescibacterota bacterium]|nr:hypothetical protein [Candidatus Latescibacterota bacterium]
MCNLLVKVLDDYDVVAVKSADTLEAAIDANPKLREVPPDVPVLTLYGLAHDEDINEYESDGFVAKLMNPEEFQTTVTPALARQLIPRESRAMGFRAARTRPFRLF